MPPYAGRFAAFLGGILLKSPRKAGFAPPVPARRRGAVVLAVVVLGLSWVSGPALGKGGEDTLGPSLEAAIGVSALSGARIGALVVRASDGEVLWSHNPELPLIPASNMKLLTALAVLELLGPTHRFQTQIRADRLPGPSGTIGELAVRGGGDPALTSEDGWRIAADLRRRGVRKIEGDILVDDSAFEDAFWHPSWGPISSRAYHAPVGALSVNYGAFFVRVSPAGRQGDAPVVSVDPPVEYLEVKNRSQTHPPGRPDSLRVSRGTSSGSKEEVVVSGGLRHGTESDLFARSVSDPALYAGSLLKLQLEGLGIEVAGTVRRGKARTGVVLLDFEGEPLSEIVELTLKYSNNAIAETLVKSVGMELGSGPGSWKRGMPLVRNQLLKTGVIDEEAVLVDGSGLSTGNRLSARMLVRALNRALSSFRVGPEMMAALPISARDGTLQDRLGAGRDRMRGKTGLLGSSRVVALSGVVESDAGEERIFSILVNGYEGSTPEAMDAVDAWVAVLFR